MPAITQQVYQAAETLLRSAAFTDALLAREASLHEPLPIVNDAGERHSWLVAVLVKNKIAGFFQIANNTTLIRYSGFPQPEAYPDAVLWIDPIIISKSAKKLAGSEDVLMEPVLSFDSNPSRIAWAVRVINHPSKIIYVVGDFAYVKENPSREI